MLAAVVLFLLSSVTSSVSADMSASALYGMSARTLAGVSVPFSELKGRVLFVTNVACR